MDKRNSLHCINALQVYDWVTRPINIKCRAGCKTARQIVTDSMCNQFRIDCRTACSQMIWLGNGLTPITGSFIIKFQRGNASLLDIFVNNERAATLRPGQTYSTTAANLQVVELVCRETNTSQSYCEGEFRFDLHYAFNSPDREIDYKKTEIYYSDHNGKRIDSASAITCKVLAENKKRKDNQPFQEVSILLQGFITIQFFNKNGAYLYSMIEPFSEIETFSLLYPPGAFAACEIIEHSVQAFPVPSVNEQCTSNGCEFIILLTLHLNVEVLRHVTLTIQGKLCHPQRKK